MLQVNSTAQLASVIRIIGTALRYRHLTHARTWIGILIEGADRFRPCAAANRLGRYAEGLGNALQFSSSERTINELLRDCNREIAELATKKVRCARRRKIRAVSQSHRSQTLRMAENSWKPVQLSGDGGWDPEGPSTLIIM